MKKGNFSVLISVYHKETPQNLEQSLRSIYDDQTLKPDQIVLFKDGPLTEDLNNKITHWKSRLGESLTLPSSEVNIGLAKALNQGLNFCKHDLVARMDSDDISYPKRFEMQYDFLLKNPAISVISCQIEEWNESMNKILSHRLVPIEHDSIYRYAKYRSPINHPAAFFRKSHILETGGYPEVYPEDYALWGKLLHENKKFHNLPEFLLKMRMGKAIYQRRGINFLKGELKLISNFKRIGFISNREYFFSILIRVLIRLAPKNIKLMLYTNKMRNKNIIK